jgi:hypothetical protein
MSDYLFESGKTLRFEFSLGDQQYTADAVTWTVFPSGIAKDETDCVQAAMITRLEEAGYDLFQ